MELCNQCGKESISNFILTTVYGEQLCEDCWDDYLMTDKGKLEYFVGICKGDYPTSDFDADFLGHISECWKRYKNLIDYSDFEIYKFEQKAIELQIL